MSSNNRKTTNKVPFSNKKINNQIIRDAAPDESTELVTNTKMQLAMQPVSASDLEKNEQLIEIIESEDKNTLKCRYSNLGCSRTFNQSKYEIQHDNSQESNMDIITPGNFLILKTLS